jgi:hypothetical protein
MARQQALIKAAKLALSLAFLPPPGIFNGYITISLY